MNAVMVRLISNPYLSRGVFWANYDLGEGKVGLTWETIKPETQKLLTEYRIRI
ncbi:MAG: hypothetical protein XD84_0675, partial [Desulfotomaculum sp. 46_80]